MQGILMLLLGVPVIASLCILVAILLRRRQDQEQDDIPAPRQDYELEEPEQEEEEDDEDGEDEEMPPPLYADDDKAEGSGSDSDAGQEPDEEEESVPAGFDDGEDIEDLVPSELDSPFPASQIPSGWDAPAAVVPGRFEDESDSDEPAPDGEDRDDLLDASDEADEAGDLTVPLEEDTDMDMGDEPGGAGDSGWPGEGLLDELDDDEDDEDGLSPEERIQMGSVPMDGSDYDGYITRRPGMTEESDLDEFF